MNINDKKNYLEQKLKQLRNRENGQNDTLEDIKFLIDFEGCFDELRNNADACYTYEQMLKAIEDYILQTSNEEEKSFLQYSVLVPSVLRMETAYLNGNFDMGTIGMKLCESYLKIADPNIMKAYLNELAYAVKNGDVNYTRKLKKVFQSGEANLDELKENLWDIYDKEDKNLAIEIVNLIYANGKFDEPAKKILLEFENREKEGNSNAEKASDDAEKVSNLEKKIHEKDDSTSMGGLEEETLKNPEQKVAEKIEEQESDQTKKDKKVERQAEAEFSRKHGEELRNLIFAMLETDNQEVQNKIVVLKELHKGSNLDNRILNMYKRDPIRAAKMLMELYNKGNEEIDVESIQLNSAKTATLRQRESSIDKARDTVDDRAQQMQKSLASIRDEITQPRLSTDKLEENIELLEALYKQATSTTSTKKELDGIKKLLSYANETLRQLKEMKNLVAEDE